MNNLKGLQSTIDSIQNQNFKNFEVWIIGGGSQEQSLNFYNTLKEPFRFLSEEDQGIYDAMNKGVARALGKYLYFLGAGDVLASNDVLKKVHKASRKEVDFIFGNVKYEENEKGTSVSQAFPRKFISEFNQKLWLKNTLHHQSVFYHKSIFEKRRYEIKYKVLADYDLNLALLTTQKIGQKLELFIAVCDPHGISKTYFWNQYVEEMSIKTKHSSNVFYPFFLVLSTIKYFYRLIFRTI